MAQNRGPKFSIRYKFLAVATLLLAVCVGTYLTVATFAFRQDKEDLIRDYQRSVVTRIGSELENSLQALGDQMRLAAYFHKERRKDKVVIEDILRKNPDVVFVGLSDRFQTVNRVLYQNSEFLKMHELSEDYFSKVLMKKRPIPFMQMQTEGESIWSSNIEGQPHLIGVGKTVIEENTQGIPVDQFAVVAYFKPDSTLKVMEEVKASDVHVLSPNGDVLVSKRQSDMFLTTPIQTPILAEAKKSPFRTLVKPTKTNEGSFLSAFTKSLSGRFLVTSRISEKQAFLAVNKLVMQSALVGGILLCFAFIGTVFFSKSLTRPIETLVGGMQKVSEGDLQTQIQVQTQDEISVLADNFNSMTNDLRKSREELESINKDLEGKVLERTKQLDERNQAVKEAQEALLRSTRLAAVGEVAGLAAHEVLNPLTSIVSRITDFKKRLEEQRSQEAQFLLDLKKSWLEDYNKGGFEKLVKTWKSPSEVNPGAMIWDEDIGNINQVGESIQEEYARLITDANFLLKESERVGRIVNSFRSLNSVNADIRRLKVDQLCNHAITVMLDFAKKNQVTLKKDYSPTPIEVHVGEDEVIQVLTNLIRNSVQSIVEKKSSEGEVSLKIIEDNAHVQILVRDNGKGISKSNQKKLFEKRFTTKTRNEGTGIGLSISRRLIRAFKGDIQLGWSEENKGTEFVVTLPKASKERVSA